MAGEAVIFIPGIKGTKLDDTNRTSWDTIWSGVQSNFETIGDLELTRAINGQFFEENPYSIIRPGEIETLAYGEFLKDLETDKPVYIFNYDWRLSASQNGSRLAEFMGYLVDKSKARNEYHQSRFPGAKVPIKSFDVITHSLGNFILRNYMRHHGLDRINKIVFTVPPFRGSLDIVSTALVGEGFFPGVKASIRKLIRTYPGALELLPSYPGASRFSPSAMHSFFTYNHWQGNVINKPSPILPKMKQALALAKRVAQNELCDLSALSEKERGRIIIIARDGYKTMQSVQVIKNDPGNPTNFVDFKNRVVTEDGDGRVPHVSSCCYYDSIQTYVIEDSFWDSDYSHGFVLKDERLQKLVNRFLFKGGHFDHKIPGGSIKKVVGIKRKTFPSELKLPYWELETE